MKNYNYNNNTNNGGVGFIGLLTLLFIGLKLTHYIDWSWWWVLSPLWIAFLVLVILVFIVGCILAIRDN